MAKCVHFVTVLFILSGMALAAETPARELQSIVRIHTSQGLGAGVIIADNKTGSIWKTDILTVFHAVIDEEGLPLVTYVEYATYIGTPTWFRFPARIEATKEEHDLALLSVVSSFALADAAEIISEDEIGRMRQLDTVWALGTPAGHRPCATMGNIQGFSESTPRAVFFLASTPVAPGNSGGGVFWRGDWDRWKICGIVSSMDSMRLSSGSRIPITHLAHFVSPFAVRAFLKEHGHGALVR